MTYKSYKKELRREQFNITLDINKEHPIECLICKKAHTLMKAHFEGWKYKDNKGYYCNKCKDTQRRG